jgi:hypothetical protein
MDEPETEVVSDLAYGPVSISILQEEVQALLFIFFRWIP